MAKTRSTGLARRERQILDILYRRGRATATEVMEALSGNPSYSTVRTQLRVLEEKGHVRHHEDGLRYVYMPAVPRHWVLAATIACATLTPLLSAIVPEWQLSLPSVTLGHSVESIAVFIPLRLAQSGQAPATPDGDGRSVSPRMTPRQMLWWTW